MQRRPEGVPPYPLARGLRVIGKPRPVLVGSMHSEEFRVLLVGLFVARMTIA